MKYSKTHLITALMVLAMVFLLDSANPADAKERASDRAETNTAKLTDTIIYKRPDVILIENEKLPRKFMIDASTEVFDHKGDKIGLKYLQFPCKAEIVYSGPKKGSFWAEKISVLEEPGFGSSSQWSDPIPE